MRVFVINMVVSVKKIKILILVKKCDAAWKYLAGYVGRTNVCTLFIANLL